MPMQRRISGLVWAGLDWVADDPLLEMQNIKTLKKVVNVMAEIKENSLDSYLIVQIWKSYTLTG